MPTYRYRCSACSNEFEQYQKFADASLTECPSCNGAIRRVIQPVGVVFKGSGWYINDSRKSETASSNGSSKSEKSDSVEAKAPKQDGADGPEKPEKSDKAEKKESKESTTTPKVSAGASAGA